MKRILVSFVTGFILLLVGTILFFLGTGIYADMKDFSSFTWELLNLKVLHYEALAEGGHMLHFGFNIVYIALVGGVLNAFVSFFLQKKLPAHGEMT